MFEPGEEILRVNDKFPPDIRDYYNALPRRGCIYTVRDIIPAQDWKGRTTIAVLLEECVNLPDPHGRGEFGFAHYRFERWNENDYEYASYSSSNSETNE